MISPNNVNSYVGIIDRLHRAPPGIELAFKSRLVDAAEYKVARHQNKFGAFVHDFIGNLAENGYVYAVIFAVGTSVADNYEFPGRLRQAH
jgi:hypothetical protein